MQHTLQGLGYFFQVCIGDIIEFLNTVEERVKQFEGGVWAAESCGAETASRKVEFSCPSFYYVGQE